MPFSAVLPILSEHCADEDVEVRLYCITSLAQHSRREIQDEIGRDGLLQICRNLARGPFPSLGSVGTAFLIHTIREEMHKEGSSVSVETRLDSISSGDSACVHSVVVILRISQGMNWSFWKPFIKAHLDSLLTADSIVCKKHTLIAL